MLCPPCARATAKGAKGPARGSLASGIDFGDIRRLCLPQLSLLEQCLISRFRTYQYVIKITPTGGANYQFVRGHTVAVPHSGPAQVFNHLEEAITNAVTSMFFTIHGPRVLIQSAYAEGRLTGILGANVTHLAVWLAVLTDPHVREDYLHFVPQSMDPDLLNAIRLIIALHATGDQHVNISELNSLALRLFTPDLLDSISQIPRQIIDRAMTVEGPGEGQEFDDLDAAARDDLARVRTGGDEDNSDDINVQPTASLPYRHNAPTNPADLLAGSLAQLIDTINIVQTDPQLVNEYAANRDLLTGSYPWIFTLGGSHSFKYEGIQTTATLRHLLLQFTAAAAACNNLIFQLADQIQRNEVNRSVRLRINNNPESVIAFHESMSDPQFLNLIRQAAGGDQQAKDTVTRHLLKHVALIGSYVPGSDMARREASKTMMALIGHFGLPSVYWTLAPDDSRNSMAIRMTFPTTSTADFPATATEDFLHAFATSGLMQPPPSYSSTDDINFNDPTLRLLIAANPTTAAEHFFHTITGILSHLVGLPPESTLRRSVATHDIIGIYGTPYAHFGVVEAQGRGSLHLHVLIWGTYSPELLQKVAYSDQFREQMLHGLRTMFENAIPDAYHIDMARTRAMNANPPPGYTTVYPQKQQRLLPPPKLYSSRTGNLTQAAADRVWNSAVQIQVHTHSATCHKPPLGRQRCRVTFPVRYVDEFPGKITHIAPKNVLYDITHDQPTIRDCETSRRNLSLYPLPIRRKELDYWELYRPHIIAPNDDADCYADLSDICVNWLKAILPAQNALVAPFNMATMFVEPGNQCAYPLFGQGQAAVTCRYTIKYMSKEVGEVAESASILHQAQRHITTYPSVAADTGEMERTASHFCQSVLHQLNGRREMSAPQAAAICLGYDMEICSHKTYSIFAYDAISYVKDKLQNADPNISFNDTSQFDDLQLDEDDDDEASDDDQDSNSLPGGEYAEGHHITDEPHQGVYSQTGKSNGIPYRLSNGSIEVVRQIVNYVYRGDELANYSLIDYVQWISVVPLPAKKATKPTTKSRVAAQSSDDDDDTNDDEDEDGNQTTASTRPGPRMPTGTFNFLSEHPLHGEYVQKVRAKHGVCKFIGPPPQVPESPRTESDRVLLLGAALFYTVILLPFSISNLIGTSNLLNTSYGAFLRMIKTYQLASTPIDSYRYNYMINLSNGLKTTRAEQAAASDYRSENSTKWATANSYEDGTANPPGAPSSSRRYGASEEDSMAQVAANVAHLRAQQAADNANLAARIEETIDNLQRKSEIANTKDGLQREDVAATIANLTALQGDIILPRTQRNRRKCATYTSDQISTTKSSITATTATTIPLQATRELDDLLSGSHTGQASAAHSVDCDGLNEKQTELVSTYEPYFANANRDRTSKVVSGAPDHIFLSGPGGTGKTYVVERMLEHLDSIGINYICGAFAASAASNYKAGATLHSLLNLPFGDSKKPMPDLKSDALIQLQQRFATEGYRARFLVVDELSTLTDIVLARIDRRLQQIMGVNQSFGGLAVLFTGDMSQIHPIGGSCLTTSAVKDPGSFAPGSEAAAGRRIFISLRVLELTEQQRASGEHVKFQANIRRKRCVTKSDIDKLTLLGRQDFVDPNWEFAPVCVTNNLCRNSINFNQARRFATKNNQPLLIWPKSFTKEAFGAYSLTDPDRENLWSNNPELCHLFVSGAPAFLNTNFGADALKRGFCNGRSITLDSLFYEDASYREQLNRQIQNAQPGEVIIVRPPDDVIAEFKSDLTSTDSSTLDPSKPNTVTFPLSTKMTSDTYRCTLSGGIFGAVTVSEFPYDLGFAITYHRVQGRTLEYLVLDLNKYALPPSIVYEIFYVGISRVRDGNHLRILPPISKKHNVDPFEHLYKLHLHPDTCLWLDSLDSNGYFNQETCNRLKAQFTVQPIRRSKHQSSSRRSVTTQSRAPLRQLPANSSTYQQSTRIPRTFHPTAYATNLDVLTNREVYLLDGLFSLTRQCINELPELKNDILHHSYMQSPTFVKSTHITDTQQLASTFSEMDTFAVDSFFDLLNFSFGQPMSYSFGMDITYMYLTTNSAIDQTTYGTIISLTNGAHMTSRHVFFPALIHNNHYVLLWVDNSTAICTIIDPMTLDQTEMTTHVQLYSKVVSFMESERMSGPFSAQAMASQPYNLSLSTHTQPMQCDAIHCGQFVCATAYFIAKNNRPPTCTDFDGPDARALEYFVANALLQGYLF